MPENQIYEWDEAKNAANITAGRPPFERMYGFDWSSALVVEDHRQVVAEQRYVAWGLIEGRLHVLVYVERGNAIRVISLRKANGREQRIYDNVRPS